MSVNGLGDEIKEENSKRTEGSPWKIHQVPYQIIRNAYLTGKEIGSRKNFRTGAVVLGSVLIGCVGTQLYNDMPQEYRKSAMTQPEKPVYVSNLDENRPIKVSELETERFSRK